MRVLGNLKIRNQFFVVFGLLMLILGLFLTWTTLNLLGIGERQREVEDKRLPIAFLLKDLKLDVVQIQQWLTDISATQGLPGFDDGFVEAAAYYQSASERIEELQRLSAGSIDPQQLSDLKDSLDGFYDMGTVMAEAYISGGPALGNPMMEEFDPFAESITDGLEEILMAQNTLADEAVREGTLAIESAFFILLILGVILLVVSTLLGWLMTHTISQPIKAVTNAINGMSQGTLTTEIQIQGKDELAVVSQAYTKAQQSIKDFLGQSQEVAMQNEDANFRLTQDLERTLESISTVAEKATLAESAVIHLDQAILDASGAGEEISINLQNLAKRIQDNSSAVTQTTASIEELTRSIESIDKMAGERVQSAQDLVRMTNEGEKQVTDSNQLMISIGSRADEVSQLIGIINGVASQTNLLAMNAAIEAAHAGEAGKGFSVVADEIRKLSESTSSSAKQIGQNLNQMIGELEESVQLSQQISGVFSTISSQSRGVKQSFEELGQSTKEMAAGSDELGQAAHTMLQISQEIDAGIGEMTQGMNDISQALETNRQQSKSLTTEIGGVKTGVSRVNGSMSSITRASGESSKGLLDLMENLQNFDTGPEQTSRGKKIYTKVKISTLIMQHAAWVSKTRDYLDGILALHDEDILDSHQWDLSKWLASNRGSGLFAPGEESKLENKHEEMHGVLKLIVSSKGSATKELLEKNHRELVQLSTDIVSILAAVRDSI